MSTNVLMPQLGDSITEGTIVRWLKKVGDEVIQDEPLLEISSDKVDAEVPSPVNGILAEIRVNEDVTVPVDSVIAVIGEPGEAIEPTSDNDDITRNPVEEQKTENKVQDEVVINTNAEAGEHRIQKSSPVVRKLAIEYNIDISLVQGTGSGGRITKEDILTYINKNDKPVTKEVKTGTEISFEPGQDTAVVPMNTMRKKIAEHMIMSRHTSAHVHSIFEIDFERVVKLRSENLKKYTEIGAKLTYMAFIAKAVVEALHQVPKMNASIDGNNIIYNKNINLGIAVALDWGLIVPVIRNAQEKSVVELSLAINDLAERARNKRLKPEEIEGGTFTITNPGVFGSLFVLPIINQPQAGILCTGAVEKRPVVIDDEIVIRNRAYFALGYDHRLIDGAVADQFLAVVKTSLEQFDASLV